MDKRTLIGTAVLIAVVGGLTYAALTRPAGVSSPSVPELPSGSFEEHAEYYDVTADYASDTPLRESAGIRADESAVNAMRRFVADTIAEFKRNGRFDSLTAEDISMMGFDQGRKLSLQILYLVALSPRTVSYIYTINDYTGGAHGNTNFKTFVFDLRTGEKLALADLFTPGSDYLGALSRVAREKLPDIMGNDPDLRMIADGTAPEAANFERFFIGGETLGILFPPYQVGPYAAGPQTLPIPLAELSDLLKPEYR